MNAWQRRFLFVFVLVGFVLIGRHSPIGSGELQSTEFADVGAPASVGPVVAPASVVQEEPVPVVVAEAPKPAPKPEHRRRIAAVTKKADEASSEPSGAKRVSIDFSQPEEPAPRMSRVTASVEKHLSSSKGNFALADALAIESDKYDPKLGEEIEEKAGFTIYKPADKSQASSFKIDKTHPVVVNQASGAIGIVTGTIVVRLRDFDQADALASSFGLESVSSDDSIATVYFRAPSDRAIDDLIELLREDGRVARADAEIIQSTRQIH